MQARSTAQALGLALLAFVFGGAGRGTGGASSAASDSTSRASAADSAKPKPKTVTKPIPDSIRAVSLLHEFFGGHFRREALPAKDSLRVLIVTLPDPIDSHGDWTYDTYLEAVRRAFETAGYVLDRFWIPGPADSVDQADSVIKKVALRDREPGILFFRDRNPDGRRLQFVLTAPETPTGGIYRGALGAALTVRKALLRHCNLPLIPLERHLIRIVGPSFSGSALSLQLVLRHFMEAGDSAEIISGSATDQANRTALALPKLHTSFRATLYPDASLNRALETLVLKPLEIPGRRVAVLRESTQYGLAVSSPDAPNRDTLRAANDSFLAITFPMSISSLRTAYEKAPAPGTAPPKGSTLPIAQPKLGLELVEPSRSKEDLPTRSALTAPTVDLLFDQVASLLYRERIQLVGLMATDVRDKLFLASELRRRVRDIRLFTYESNILYLRSDWRSSLAGMLVLSTYPLTVPGSPVDTDRPGGNRPIFANNGAQGTYNAVLLQLGMAQELLDYDSRLDTLSIPRPPIWLAAVGYGAFLPLRQFVDTGQDVRDYMAEGPTVLQADSARRIAGASVRKPEFTRAISATAESARVNPESLSAAGSERKADAVPSSLRVGTLQLLAVILSTLALLFLAYRGWKTDAKVSQSLAAPASSIAPPQSNAELFTLQDAVRYGSLVLHERLYSGLRLLAVAGIWLAASAALFRAAWDLQTCYWWIFPIVALVTTVAISRAAWSAIRVLVRLWRPGRAYWRLLNWIGAWRAPSQASVPLEMPTWPSWGMEIVGRVAVVVFGLIYFWFTCWFAYDAINASDQQLLYLRLSNVESLLTPFVPLLASGLAFAFWCSWHLTRISLLRRDTAFGAACTREMWGTADPPTEAKDDLTKRQKRAAEYARRCWSALFMVFPHQAVGLSLVALAVGGCVWLTPKFGHTLESISFPGHWWQLTGFDWLLRLSILAGFVTTLWAVIRLLSVWFWLRDCLDELTVLPFVRVFKSSLPDAVRRLARFSLPGRNLAASVGATSIMQWHQLRILYSESKPFMPDNDLEQKVDQLMTGNEVYPRDSATHGAPVELANKILLLQQVLAGLWALEKLTEPSPPTSEQKQAAENLKLFREKAEVYLATQVVGFAEWVVAHLRVLALFLLLSLLLTTVLLYGYPFQPQGLVRIIFTFILLIAVSAVIYVSIQMNRHELLSIIAGTGAGVVSWDARLVTNLLTFALVPLLTLLGSALPGLRSGLLDLVQPLQKLFQP